MFSTQIPRTLWLSGPELVHKTETGRTQRTARLPVVVDPSSFHFFAVICKVPTDTVRPSRLMWLSSYTNAGLHRRTFHPAVPGDSAFLSETEMKATLKSLKPHSL